MPIQHVSLAFAEAPDTTLDDFTGGVHAGMLGNASFPTPPVDMASLANAKTDFENAMAAMTQGGMAATAAKNDARDIVVGELRQLAAYVEETSQNDLAILLSSGFAAASTNQAQSPLPKASIKKITNANSGQLIAEANTMANVQSWQARWQVGAGAWQAADCVKMTRK